jgi:cardiolipin synthase A/B
VPDPSRFLLKVTPMLRALACSFLFACAAGALACGAPSDATGTTTSAATLDLGAGPDITSFFFTPSAGGEQPVIDAINGAESSIRMIMFHLTNPAVVDALVAAAGRGVDVEMILDNGNLSSHTPKSITEPLAKAGIKVIPSSTGFRITHVKSLVIDNTKALIMSLNLTMTFTDTRDYAVVTTDTGVIAEFLKVFDADVVNAQNGTATTPALSSPYLAWSPVNSESRLSDFVNSAKKTLVATSENLGDPDIQKAMIAAAKRGVNVRVIAPLCDQNVVPLLDLPYLAALAAGGVEARAMPTPSSAEVPYMHAKMMIADGSSAFVGSVNFSSASTTDARELGIFFKDAAAIAMVSGEFEQDWSNAITPPPASSVSCTSVTTTDGGAPHADAGPPPATDSGPPPQVDAGAPPQPDAAPPQSDAATGDADATAEDSGSTCPGYASPTTAASCTGCSGSDCQANGCYGGYWCNESTSACESASKVPCSSK